MRTRTAALPLILLPLLSAPAMAADADMTACAGDRADVVAACTRLISAARSTGVTAAAFVFRARAEDKAGDDRAALADYGKAIALQPGQVAWWRARALHHYVRADYREALSDQVREVALDGSPDALCRRANTQGRMGVFLGEALDARAALAMPGAGVGCHTVLAEALVGLGDMVGAAAQVAATAALSPQDADLPAFEGRLGDR